MQERSAAAARSTPTLPPLPHRVLRARRGPGGLHLTGAELVALQLLALGYVPAEIARLRAAAVTDVLRDLERAFAALAAPTARLAIGEARRRGLIV